LLKTKKMQITFQRGEEGGELEWTFFMRRFSAVHEPIELKILHDVSIYKRTTVCKYYPNKGVFFICQSTRDISIKG
jgi:hypothetical protein